ncbi:hypothetical protein [Alcanivorax sp. 1008]|uniref:hypothetical protein n=1 Tax=Alcanivorax sp. 1008 TaxID=2816853 RepID=UPI001D9D0AE6|nr:hypothetical protein [Alcanivorax sp. 1008]MCC1496777.1 hypothetical protein [Alcanivorax sp. 1008]
MGKYTKKLLAAQAEGMLTEFPEGSKEFDMLAEEGFLIHWTSNEDLNEADIHTHGVEAILGATELRIVLPVRPEMAATIFHIVVDHAKKTGPLKPGVLNGLLKGGVPLLLVEDADEHQNRLLRVIIPDPEGNIDEGKMAPEYAAQFHSLPGRDHPSEPESGPMVH